ncbi:methyl-accepting chemotaxis protein [Fretibacterium sp. OH1220_COT-178]|uniref:methyl-accepting chemotaxis protein n=1 Tax=Fretibacterium sp. OH1220_COT-178 TaxID=2491047 RepID=UPI0013153BD7|nr:methyl-accepting chemotaxis protein [Fretibacterium sp. OH1220_COT-178]
MSIKGKLRLIAVTVLIVILTMAGVTYLRAGTLLDDFLNRAGAEITVNSARIIEDQFDRYVSIVELAASAMRHAAVRVDGQEERHRDIGELCRSMLKNVGDQNIMNLFLGWEATGLLSIASMEGEWTAPAGYDARPRSWYREAVAARGSVVVAEPYVEAASGKAVLAVTKAVYDEANALIGVAAIEVTLDALSDFVVGRQIFGQGAGALVLKNGLLVACRDKEHVFKANILSGKEFDGTMHALAPQIVGGGSGVADCIENGEMQRIFYAPVGHGFFFYVAFPVEIINDMVHGLTLLLVLIAAVALLLTGTLIFTIIRGLSRSLKNMSSVTQKLGGGDLTVRFEEVGRDELTHMARELNCMVGSVSETLHGIQIEADATTREADNLAAIAEETLAAMEEVAASVERVNGVVGSVSAAVEETNASIGEIADSAQASAHNATEGAEQAAQVAELSKDASDEVSCVVDGMKKAKDKSERSIAQIRELGRSVDSISSFVATITSIADQTNLLALNAAIEAARAGEAGRGFAVVAEEVRKLAEESARAAQEVEKLIEGLQQHSEESISATEATEQLLTETVTTAESTQTKLNEATDAIARLNEAIQNIAAVSQQQAASSEEMTTAVHHVAEANRNVVNATDSIHTSTQETTKAAEAIATAAQGLSATADKLQRLVGTFTFTEKPAILPRKQN